jgi:carboxypeptidase family protein
MPRTRLLFRRAALGSAALIVVALTVAACNLEASPPESPAASPTRDSCGPDEVAGGGINGRVVDAAGNPLNDIFIFIQTPDGFRGTTRTGEDGVFTAPGVSGDFQITTTDIDYAEVVREVTVPCGELVDVELVLTPVEDQPSP